MEDDDLVAAVAEVPQPGEDPRRVVEEVGEDRDDPAFLEPLGQVVEDDRPCPTSRRAGVTSSTWISSFRWEGWPAGLR